MEGDTRGHGGEEADQAAPIGVVLGHEGGSSSSSRDAVSRVCNTKAPPAPVLRHRTTAPL